MVKLRREKIQREIGEEEIPEAIPDFPDKETAELYQNREDLKEKYDELEHVQGENITKELKELDEELQGKYKEEGVPPEIENSDEERKKEAESRENLEKIRKRFKLVGGVGSLLLAGVLSIVGVVKAIKEKEEGLPLRLAINSTLADDDHGRYSFSREDWQRRWESGMKDGKWLNHLRKQSPRILRELIRKTSISADAARSSLERHEREMDNNIKKLAEERRGKNNAHQIQMLEQKVKNNDEHINRKRDEIIRLSKIQNTIEEVLRSQDEDFREFFNPR